MPKSKQAPRPKATRGRPVTGRAREGVIPIRFSGEERKALEWLAEKEAVSSFVRRIVVGLAQDAQRKVARAETMALGFDQQGKEPQAKYYRDLARREKLVAQTTPGHPTPVEAWEPAPESGMWPDDPSDRRLTFTQLAPPSGVWDTKAFAAEIAKLLKKGGE